MRDMGGRDWSYIARLLESMMMGIRLGCSFVLRFSAYFRRVYRSKRLGFGFRWSVIPFEPPPYV